MIKIENLNVRFGDQIVLNDINLIINKGEITTIVGQSGCGKTVLMKSIEGLITPDSGNIFIDHLNITQAKKQDLNRIRKKIAMLFQGSALLDSLNVFQNIALPLIEHSELSEKQIFELVKDKLRLLDLDNVLQKMPSDLSGGMKKRVALARAVILQPEYIIYDEPTTGLDPIISREIIDLMIKLHKEFQITSIIITHDLECIQALHSRIVMIHDKSIVFDGRFEEFCSSSDATIKKFLNFERV